MSDERYQRVREIFHEVLDGQPTDRDELLTRLCQGDEVLREEVESLLAHADAPVIDIEAAARRIHEALWRHLVE